MIDSIEIKPQFFIDQTVDSSVAYRIALIDKTIHEQPIDFLNALVTLGASATQGTAELSDDSAVVSMTTTPDQLIKEYFRNRYDRGVEFDADTESAIKNDSTFQALHEAQEKAKAQMVNTGIMQKAMRANPEQEVSARDAARIARLGSYLTRVAAFYGLSTELPGAVEPEQATTHKEVVA